MPNTIISCQDANLFYFLFHRSIHSRFMGSLSCVHPVTMFQLTPYMPHPVHHTQLHDLNKYVRLSQIDSKYIFVKVCLQMTCCYIAQLVTSDSVYPCISRLSSISSSSFYLFYCSCEFQNLSFGHVLIKLNTFTEKQNYNSLIFQNRTSYAFISCHLSGKHF